MICESVNNELIAEKQIRSKEKRKKEKSHLSKWSINWLKMMATYQQIFQQKKCYL